ncbi:MAG: tetratricopeptide repeat protein [Polyangiaceae bacterium]
MESREADLESKISKLEKLLSDGGEAHELFDAAEATALALEFRGTDAMIGLDPVAPELLDRARAAVQKARAKAAKEGVPEACVQAAEAIWLGRDSKRAKEAVALAKRAGNEPRALHLLGLFAFHGFGQKKNLGESLAYQRQAAEGGHADAMFEVYAMMAQGLGCTADPKAALEWCERSARAGNARAMSNLGGFYATGNQGLPLDPEESVRWYDRAARAGHGRAAATLGIMHALGSGAPRSVAEATRYFALSEEIGFDFRPLAESAGVDLADLMKVTLAPPSRAKKGTGKLPPMPKLPAPPRTPGLPELEEVEPKTLRRGRKTEPKKSDADTQPTKKSTAAKATATAKTAPPAMAAKTAAKKPAANAPAAKKPAAAKATAAKKPAAANATAAKKPAAAKAPAAKKPAAAKAAKPAPKKPAAKAAKPAPKKPAAKAAKKPAAKATKPAPKKPAAKATKPAPKKPAAKATKPAAKNPTAKPKHPAQAKKPAATTAAKKPALPSAKVARAGKPANRSAGAAKKSRR